MRDNWKEYKLDDLGRHYGGLTNKSKDNFGKGFPFIPYLNIFENSKINPSDLDFVEIFPSESQNKVKYGDLFFTTSSETPHEVGMTSVLLDDLDEAYLNSFCFGFRLNDFNDLLPEYAAYLFRGKEIRKLISDLAQGSTRYNLSKSIFFDKLKFNLPPLSQQRKIASILSTCDEVIEKTEAAIAKYQALKHGMMHDLFTRGIDVNTGKLRASYQDAPELYKESDLGIIPKEWEDTIFENYLIKNLYGPRFSANDYAIDGNVKTIRGMDFSKDGEILYNQAPTALLPKSKVQAHLLEQGDVVVVTTADCGLTAVFEEQTFQYIPSAYSVKFRFNEKVEPYFIKYFMQTDFSKRLVNKYVRQGTLGNLPGSDVVGFCVGLPNIHEQYNMVDRLKGVEKKIKIEQSALAKYQQLKAGLMQDLLTGKVEVRVAEEIVKN